MRYQALGKTDLKVSELALGAMTFDESWGWNCPTETCRELIDLYIEAGGNFIDTANVCTSGRSEELLGGLLGNRRRKVVLASKHVNPSPCDEADSSGAYRIHRRKLVQSIEKSLRRLRTDYIDLIWIHARGPVTPIDEMMRALEDVMRAGKVLYVGASNFPAWEVARANTAAELRSWRNFSAIQLHYNLTDRAPERELIPMARELGLSVTAWSPLANGLLTGKYETARKNGEKGRLDVHPFVTRTERNQKVVDEIRRVSTELHCSPARVVIRWLMNRGAIPILGARTVDQLRDNLGASDFSLPVEMISRLDAISRFDRIPSPAPLRRIDPAQSVGKFELNFETVVLET